MVSTIVVRLPADQKQMLSLAAKKKRQSVSAVVRTALEEHFQQNIRKDKNLFLELAKIGKSARVKNAPRDLSKNYKKYLYGKTSRKFRVC